MEKLFYPALFHKSEEGGFWISFPDFPECFTEGDDMKQAYEMTVEALGLALVNRKEEKEEIPDPSDLDKIQNEDGTILNLQSAPQAGLLSSAGIIISTFSHKIKHNFPHFSYIFRLIYIKIQHMVRPLFSPPYVVNFELYFYADMPMKMGRSSAWRACMAASISA